MILLDKGKKDIPDLCLRYRRGSLVLRLAHSNTVGGVLVYYSSRLWVQVGNRLFLGECILLISIRISLGHFLWYHTWNQGRCLMVPPMVHE